MSDEYVPPPENPYKEFVDHCQMGYEKIAVKRKALDEDEKTYAVEAAADILHVAHVLGEDTVFQVWLDSDYSDYTYRYYWVWHPITESAKAITNLKISMTPCHFFSKEGFAPLEEFMQGCQNIEVRLHWRQPMTFKEWKST